MFDYRLHYDFLFSATVDAEVAEKINLGVQIIELLNQHLKLSDFTQSITSLFIIPQCINPQHYEYLKPEERKVFRRKTKVLELYLLADYATVVALHDDEVTKYLSSLYLSGISRLIQVKDFKLNEFVSEVERVLYPYLKS